MTEAKKKKGKPSVKGPSQNRGSSTPIKENGLELLVITRETYRAPVDPDSPVQVQIGKHCFNVVNVARRGIGFIIPGPDLFHVGDIVESLTVICGKMRIAVKGRIVHVSPSEGNKYLCGLEIIHGDATSLRQFEDYLERNRLALFSSSESPDQ